MTIRTLPEARTFPRPQNFQWDAPTDVLARWAATPAAAADSDATTITMFEVIGEDFWTGGGVTAKRVSAALRAIGDRDVTVKINSPGGDMFEGIAIYNLLRKHPAKVSIEVMGWAASAASIIAMAGDDIRMGLGTFMMVHNAWGGVIGNRHDMREAAEMFDGFDSAIADIYEARTGQDRSTVTALMDAETFMGPQDAVAKGFADSVDEGLSLPDDDDTQNAGQRPLNAVRQLDAILAQQGMSRGERRSFIQDVKSGTRNAADPAMQDAGAFAAAAQALLQTIKS
ncbi:peptidase [Sulfitobacter alexandrii]|uniref:ATP-dependent Clp protease proteolytic subunit n=1 Tax=Sulfitobacter alexandrii TaxID=1917485 RepID=A0A1J0WGG3_9RHOB|nr:head maturation protease, ClpP-related [Sulfitobacter alexandrii]APE43407.1 peptidase [Sulfitobacter alexandrii]